MPRILDNPPLIFHPTEKQAPGLKTGFKEALAMYRKSLPEHMTFLYSSASRHEDQRDG